MAENEKSTTISLAQLQIPTPCLNSCSGCPGRFAITGEGFLVLHGFSWMDVAFPQKPRQETQEQHLCF